MALIKNINLVSYRRLLFTVNDFFLCNDYTVNADINYFIQSPVNVNNELRPFYTLLIDLQLEESELWKEIYHRTRTEITSFLNHQQFEHVLKFNLKPAELKDFISMYDVFAELKKIRKAETARLAAYNSAGILAVTYIRQQKKMICINVYRVNKQRATNLYSFTMKHALQNVFNNTHFGKAHRALHWLDILEFKKLSVNCYDLCGWYDGAENNELLNINRFKEQFSRSKVKEYSGVIYKNKLLRLISKIKKRST